MTEMIVWMEAHDKLAGWAQFAGAILAIILTYFTAFAPTWRRKKQLADSGKRLLSHGFEVIESYHRVSANFLPLPVNVRFASMTMSNIVEEMNRFPIYELDDQGSNSLARRLIAMGGILGGVRLVLDTTADDIEGRAMTEEERDLMREFLGGRLKEASALVLGLQIQREEWAGIPASVSGDAAA